MKAHTTKRIRWIKAKQLLKTPSEAADAYRANRRAEQNASYARKRLDPEWVERKREKDARYNSKLKSAKKPRGCVVEPLHTTTEEYMQTIIAEQPPEVVLPPKREVPAIKSKTTTQSPWAGKDLGDLIAVGLIKCANPQFSSLAYEGVTGDSCAYVPVEYFVA